MGEFFNELGFANGVGRRIVRACFLDGVIQFSCELYQFGGVAVDLAFALHVGSIEVLLQRLFLVHFHLGVGVGKPVAGGDWIGLLNVLGRLIGLLRTKRDAGQADGRDKAAEDKRAMIQAAAFLGDGGARAP